MAQTYSKQKIFEYAKLAEIPIMVIAVIGFFGESLWVVMVALFLMGVQSAIYAPSKYGLIRDVGGTDGLSYGVGTMELLTFLGVLVGQVAAGVVSDLSIGVTSILSGILLFFAISGYISSRRIRVEEEKPTDNPKDSVEPLTFLFKTAKWARSIKGLNTTIIGLGGFWLVAALIQMNILVHAPLEYNLSNTSTALVMALIAIGIGFGCFFAGKLSKNRVELGMVPLGGLGLSIILTIFATVELSLTPFIINLFFAAVFAGFYKVPLSAWIQERVEGRKLGLALAYNQLVAFLFILVAAVIFGYVIDLDIVVDKGSKYFNTFIVGSDNKILNTFIVFKVLAVISWIMTIITMANIPAMMLRFVAYILTHSYFKIEIHGKEHIPKKSGALLVANHLSLLDPFFMVAAAPRMLRFVMAKGLYDFWLFHWLMKRLNMIPISAKLDKVKLEEFNTLCQKEVNQGHVLCIFPEGQISRIGHLLEFKKGIEHIAKGVDAPIIPIQMSGLSGIALSFEIGSSKPIIPPWFKNFRKRITIEIGEPLPANSSATHLRQKVQVLNAVTFKRRLRENHSLQYFMKSAVKKFKSQSFQYGAEESTFLSFYNQSQEIAGYWLQGKGKYVGIDLGNHPKLGMIHSSCLLAGKVPVFFHPEMKDEDRQKISKDYELASILTESDLPELINTKHKQSFQGAASEVAGVFFEPDENDGWATLNMTHANFLASVRGFMQLFKNPGDAKIYSELPAYTSYGNLTKIWTPFFFGMSVFLNDEKASLSEIWTSSGVNALFSSSETVQHLNNQLKSEDWDQLNYLITGNDAIPEDLHSTLSERNIFVSQSLGVAKGGVTVAVNTPDYELFDIGGNKMEQQGSQPGSCGRPLPGIGIKIINEDGQELGPGEKGTLYLFGAGICDDYKENDWLNTHLNAYYDEKGFLFC